MNDLKDIATYQHLKQSTYSPIAYNFPSNVHMPLAMPPAHRRKVVLQSATTQSLTYRTPDNVRPILHRVATTHIFGQAFLYWEGSQNPLDFRLCPER